jgi:hypothetical protein
LEEILSILGLDDVSGQQPTKPFGNEEINEDEAVRLSADEG